MPKGPPTPNVAIPTEGSAQRSQAILLGATADRLLVSLVVTGLLGRILSPANYGFFALVSAVLIVGRDLLDLGTTNVAAREIIVEPGREKDVLQALLGWRAATGVFLALACVIFAFAQSGSLRTGILFAAAAVLAIMYLNAVLPVFQVRQAHGGPAALALAAQFALLAGCVGLYVAQAAGALYALLVVIREAAVTFGSRIMANRLLGYRPVPRLRGKDTWPFLAKALAFGGAAVSYHLYFNSGAFLVWFFRPEPELGAFAAAFRPIQPLLALPWILMVPLLPVLTQRETHHRDSPPRPGHRRHRRRFRLHPRPRRNPAPLRRQLQRGPTFRR